MAPTTAHAPCAHAYNHLSVFPEALKGKKILLCTESFGPVNGVSRTTMMLVSHLRANGCDLAVVSPQNSTAVNTFIPKLGTIEIEVRLRGYPVPFNPELSIAYLVRLSELYRRTFGCPPDLIYLASPASLGFQVMLQLRQRPRADQVPVVCNFQTDLAGYCKTLFPWPLGDIADCTFAAVQSFLFRHPSVRSIFYPSTHVRRYLERHRVQPDKMELLGRGVDANTFHPSKRSKALRESIGPNGEVILICVARLAAEKGFDFLARAAQELDARGLHFKLYLVGGNRQAEVEAEVKHLFSDSRCKSRVVFAGFKVGEALAEAYASADLFLHCSVSETFGLVVLESFASGVPVVARDMGGPSDTVDDGVSGFLTPPDDLSAFVDKVILLANDKKLRHRFGGRALKQAREATWDKINNKVAWKMLQTIQQREQELAGPPPHDSHLGRSRGPSAVRETVIGSKLQVAAALGVIVGFWGLVSVYLAFTKAKRWVRSLFSIA
ncbi:glycosyl transferase group 1 [Diaporthe helianthi]|uniref:Glycosyl transferase group 1 n=1 Tax=Diaporthe helianthi TaxID=158607 RepID=A0A2P5HIE3_DIAHE|nr:glycosyl transferase group 1 [Diaporthe helianthi]